MSDNINLLPEELRMKEEEERRRRAPSTPLPSSWKEPKKEEPITTQKEPPVLRAPAKNVEKAATPSFWSRLFQRRGGTSSGSATEPLKRTEEKTQDTSENFSSMEVNLLPGQGAAERHMRPWSQIAMISISAFVLASLALGGAWWYLRRGLEQATAQATTLDRDIASLKKKIAEVQSAGTDVQNFNQRLEHVQTVIREHVIPDAVFTFLESETLSDVMMERFLFQRDKGILSISVIAKDADAVAGQLLRWAARQDVVQALRVTSVRRQERTDLRVPVYAFQVEMTIHPDIFQPYSHAFTP